eukprot:5865278-Pleurochrysis_carterae.AAC.1
MRGAHAPSVHVRAHMRGRCVALRSLPGGSRSEFAGVRFDGPCATATVWCWCWSSPAAWHSLSSFFPIPPRRRFASGCSE